MSPCRYPGCRDRNDEPRLTDRLFCDQSEHRYRRLLDWIVLDWVTLHTGMPTPARFSDDGSQYESPKAKSFGHPAEWASITAAEIADALNWAEDAVRDDLGHEPPPHPGVREQGRVAHAYHYLTTPAQFDRLCTFDAAEDTAVQLTDLHTRVRRTLGLTRFTQSLPTPCPWCDITALAREVGLIQCRACGKTVDEQHYGWLANYLIDRMIDDYDRQHATGMTPV